MVARYELARRWYRLKARLLGLDTLAYYDRMAPVAESEQQIPYEQARETVLDCYRGFSDELGATAEEFFEGSFIDAPPQPGKRGGAFCAYTVPSAHPYVLLNYTSRPGDVLTMAHELGHGVHAALARPKGMFEFTTPLTVAETASIFGETIVLERLLTDAPDASARLSLLAESLDGAVAAVFRQVAMNRFEDRIHTERRESGELSTEAFGRGVGSRPRPTCSATPSSPPRTTTRGGATCPTSSTRPATSTPTPTATCWRCRSTAASRRRASPSCPPTSTCCAPAARCRPRSWAQIVGVDLADPGFWSSGLDLIERQLDAAEQAAREAGRI